MCLGFSCGAAAALPEKGQRGCEGPRASLAVGAQCPALTGSPREGHGELDVILSPPNPQISGPPHVILTELLLHSKSRQSMAQDVALGAVWRWHGDKQHPGRALPQPSTCDSLLTANALHSCTPLLEVLTATCRGCTRGTGIFPSSSGLVWKGVGSVQP